MRSRWIASIVLLVAACTVAASSIRAEEKRPSYTFQAVLLVADDSGPGSMEGVPPNAQKALRDAGKFLPYKGYHLLDVGWIRTSFRGQTRFAGPDGGTTYEVHVLVDPRESTPERLVINEFGIVPVIAGSNSAVAPILSTTFSMALGETVIVGTSKLNGPDKKALVVLLTAMP